MQKLSIYWSRKDFRLNDNPALFSSINYAQKNKLKLLPIYIIDEKFINNFKWNFGHPYRYYLSYALSQYTNEFKNFLIAVGNPVEIFTRLSIDYQLEVFANNEVEPYSRRRDYEVKNTLQKNNSTLHIFPDQTSISLTTKTGVGNFYSVFTPFKKSVQDEFINKLPLPKADLNKAEILNPSKISIKKIEFENTKTLQKSLFTYLDKPWILSFGGGQVNLDKIYQRPVYEKFWYTSENEAIKQFDEFNKLELQFYSKNRNLMGEDIQKPLTSRMSVALAWGLISSRTLINKILKKHSISDTGAETYISELIWREFYKYIMYHNPHCMNMELQTKKRNIMWREGKQAKIYFQKWIQAQTGYKIIDSAMHQIIQTGWMHNRARMIVASVLTKNLGIDWRWGQDYFRSVLLDLDEASNNGGWQWGASVGIDPKPIRIFNPYSQQERFDPDEKYIKKYLPKDYDLKEPIIDHKIARAEALARYNLNIIK